MLVVSPFLKSRIRCRFTPQVDPTKPPASNLHRQQFTATKPNEKWVTGIPYLPPATGWVYLAVVLDLFRRKVVGWEMSDSLATPPVSSALRKAIENRRPTTGELLHHSDRGCQYTSNE